jgi:hypothetical protein
MTLPVSDMQEICPFLTYSCTSSANVSSDARADLKNRNGKNPFITENGSNRPNTSKHPVNLRCSVTKQIGETLPLSLRKHEHKKIDKKRS